MKGVNKGLKELYENRYDSDGNLQRSCLVGAETVYGESACEDAVAAWVS
jgi:hypothetical protein